MLGPFSWWQGARRWARGGMMDIATLAFYAVICAALSWAAPRLGAPVMRLAIGAAVGMAAAAVLPFLRPLLS